MKRLLLVAIFALLALFSISVSADKAPSPDPYAYWECGASSPYAYGVGVSTYQPTAASIALRECAARTPPGYVCVINYCVLK